MENEANTLANIEEDMEWRQEVVWKRDNTHSTSHILRELEIKIQKNP
jgi:hypothetical protein